MQAQLSREIGASRQLLQLLAAGLRDSAAEPHARHGANGSNGAAHGA